MGIENLTDEQKVRAKECKSVEELVEFLGAENIDLSDDDLEAATGGFGDIAYRLSFTVPMRCKDYPVDPAET